MHVSTRNLTCLFVMAQFGCEGAIIAPTEPTLATEAPPPGGPPAPTAQPPPPPPPGVPPAPVPSECDATPLAFPRTPLRRLTATEYRHTLADLVGVEISVDDFDTADHVARFQTNANLAITEGQAQRYFEIAEEVAEARTAAILGSLECDPRDRTCAEALVRTFGRRAFRRPVPAAIEAELIELWAAERARSDPEIAATTVVRMILSSPYFLYHLESLDLDEAGRLSRPALASRLSYFLWSSLPDDELLSAALDGGLDTPEGLVQQAQRLLDDDARVSRSVQRFFSDWLEVPVLVEQSRDPDLYPDWSFELADAYAREALDFPVRALIEERRPLSSLLTASFTVAGPQSARVYGGVPEADGRVDLDPMQRRGVLMMLPFLTRNAHDASVSWVHRGKFVRERLLCMDMPPPPPDVNDAADNAVTPGRLQNPRCKNCHELMDPIGVAFDGFDAIGALRTVDDGGQPATGAGEIIRAPDPALEGAFSSPLELTDRLAASEVVLGCLATQWTRFAQGRKGASTAGDRCSQDEVIASFLASERTLRDLMLAIVSAPSFQHVALED